MIGLRACVFPKVFGVRGLTGLLLALRIVQREGLLFILKHGILVLVPVPLFLRRTIHHPGIYFLVQVKIHF
jgi:hypothetical protein